MNLTFFHDRKSGITNPDMTFLIFADTEIWPLDLQLEIDYCSLF